MSTHLITTKRNGSIKDIKAVNPHCPYSKGSRYCVGCIYILGKNTRRQPIMWRVCPSNDLFNILEFQEGLHWSKYLISGNQHVILDIWEDSRLDIESLGTQFFPSRLKSSPLSVPDFMYLRIFSNCSVSIWGPCSTPFLKGSPTIRFNARTLAFSTNSSYTLSCTNVRDPAQQDCPCRYLKFIPFRSKHQRLQFSKSGKFCTWLKKTAEWDNSTALSTSASSQMMKGDFPRSSNVTGF